MKTRILKYLTVIGLVLIFLAFVKPAYSQTFTFTPNTSGVTTNTTLVGGQTGVVLLGTTIATSANTTITSAIINFSTTGSISGNPIAFFPNAKLYESTSGTFASATQISTASFGQSGSNIVCSTNANLTFNTGTSYTFYLVADINASNCCGVLPMTTTLNFSQIYSYSPSVTYTNSSSGTGVTYTLATGTISVTGYNSTSNGISTPNLLYGQTNIVLFGFAITAQGSLSINQIFIPSTTTGANIFTNGKLYRSTTGPTFSSASVISGASVNFNYGTNGVNITGLSETFTATAATTVYYFFSRRFYGKHKLHRTNNNTI